jgi:hypothetical protein
MKMSYRMLPKRQRAALTEIPGASMKSENQTQDPAGDDKEQAGNEFFGGNTEHGTEVESLAQPWTTLEREPGICSKTEHRRTHLVRAVKNTCRAGQKIWRQNQRLAADENEQGDNFLDVGDANKSGREKQK